MDFLGGDLPSVDEVTFRELVQNLKVGVALVSADDWAVLFENAQFFKWFPPGTAEVETLADRIEDLNTERAASRVDAGRPYSFETSSKQEGQEEPLRVSMQSFDGMSKPCYLIQCQSAAKEMEVQFMLDSYSRLAEKNARELEKEKDRVEKLLLNIMPRAVFEEMREYGTATPQNFDAVSILMLDFVGFTDMAISQDATAIISELNDIFSAFDRITEMFDCERVRTIGDAYMAVSGLLDSTPDHAANIARLALRFRRYLERRNQAHSQQWTARIGINTGSVIGSLVGVQKYVYDLFGPGVNLAARMETISEPMRITLTEDTHDLIKDEFLFTDRGHFDIKGFGSKRLYFLDGELSR
jgi:class 3 adenylate cyclase